MCSNMKEQAKKTVRTLSEIEKAEQQFVGYAHAADGYGVVALAEAMGLTISEWDRIKQRNLHTLKKLEVEMIDELFTPAEVSHE